LGIPRTEQKTGPLGSFDPTLFSKMIQGLGLKFRWSRAVECPCRMDGTDTFDPSCAECGGDGWWYVNPVESDKRYQSPSKDYVEVSCTFSQANLKPSMFETFGQFTFGDAIMTFQDEMRVAFRDRFVGIDQEMAWTELLTSKGPGTTVTVGKTGRNTSDQLASLRYEPIRINFLADEDKVRYYKGSDYRITEATNSQPARLQFLPGKGPALNKTYTIHYTCKPIWIVDDATYGIQILKGPDSGFRGDFAPRTLPTTFKVRLDFMTRAVGS